MEKLRLDKYLWAIRMFKTRTLSTDAIDGGKVKWNGVSVKPSRTVSVGDRYTIRTPERHMTIEVAGLLYSRVGYEEAVKYYTDLTTDEERLQVNPYAASSFYTGKRLSKTGHPTKKQRRDLEGFLGEEQ